MELSLDEMRVSLERLSKHANRSLSNKATHTGPGTLPS